MKKSIFILLLLLTYINSNADSIKNFKTYYEAVENGYDIYADNGEYAPISVKINFKVKNLKLPNKNNTVYVVPAKTKRFKIGSLRTIKKGKYSISFSSTFNYGNHNQKTYDKEYLYYLPFLKGKTFKIDQGYNGTFSHQNKNKLDFKMPVGSKITAARDGIVIKVLDINNKRCDEKKCKKFNNYIYIYHKDGTIAEYVHIKKKGAKVKVGDVIKAGQFIAESGNVGFSTGPHLHYSVYLQHLDGQEFLKTKFKTNKGDTTEFLVEKESYTRNYN
jgi:murein DD-endopeptidase MepM/ murein hydrolase activator NlpD